GGSVLAIRNIPGSAYTTRPSASQRKASSTRRSTSGTSTSSRHVASGTNNRLMPASAADDREFGRAVGELLAAGLGHDHDLFDVHLLAGVEVEPRFRGQPHAGVQHRAAGQAQRRPRGGAQPEPVTHPLT